MMPSWWIRPFENDGILIMLVFWEWWHFSIMTFSEWWHFNNYDILSMMAFWVWWHFENDDILRIMGFWEWWHFKNFDILRRMVFWEWWHFENTGILVIFRMENHLDIIDIIFNIFIMPTFFTLWVIGSRSTTSWLYGPRIGL
jgi:hypothetical protein